MGNNRLREQAGWQPVWDKGIVGWTVKFIKANMWRCDGILEFDDLMQDAYLTFLRVRYSYPRVVEPEHFMALYKTAMVHEMTDKSRYKRKKSEAIADTDVDVAEMYVGHIGEKTNEGYLRVLIGELPEEVKLALLSFSDESKRQEMLNKPHGIRENLNMKLRRVAGLAPHVDVVGCLKKALAE